MTKINHENLPTVQLRTMCVGEEQQLTDEEIKLWNKTATEYAMALNTLNALALTGHVRFMANRDRCKVAKR